MESGGPILDPDLPIVDAHHHLWVLPEESLSAMDESATELGRLASNFRAHERYLLDEFLADVRTGHNVQATVFVDAHTMYRASGPESLRSVGEVEFVNGVAAMAASGLFGRTRVCAGIVGGVDFTLGAAVEEVLAAHIQAGGGRYRGARSTAVVPFDEDPAILGYGVGTPNLLRSERFRTGVRRMTTLGLSLDVWLLDPQLPELIEFAQALADTQIVLDHVGTPVGTARYAGRREERFPLWCDSIRALSRCPNVAVKLGGLGLPFCGFASFASVSPTSAEQLATEWRPYIETCIEAFGVARCMFESNFPVDAATCSYRVLWNAFKRVTHGASESERAALFSETAIRIYRLQM
jgi:predicted TIM-barrel fold metal-dependent hydrolase